MTATTTAAPASVRTFRARPTHQIEAVRLHAGNLDDVIGWVYTETGARPLWNDGRLHLTASNGLVSAQHGDYIAHSLFGFAAYTATEFHALYELYDLPPRNLDGPSVAGQHIRTADCE